MNDWWRYSWGKEPGNSAAHFAVVLTAYRKLEVVGGPFFFDHKEACYAAVMRSIKNKRRVIFAAYRMSFNGSGEPSFEPFTDEQIGFMIENILADEGVNQIINSGLLQLKGMKDA